MNRLNSFSKMDAQTVLRTVREFGSPVYLYDEQLIVNQCAALLAMPNAYGLTVRYAMKANSGKSILRIIAAHGLKFDASSLNEVKRARMAGIGHTDIILTTQEVPLDAERRELEDMIGQGLKYNVCSLRQLELIGDFAAANRIPLAIRVHPGVGSGESASRNTGDKYSCFGIHLSDLEQAVRYAGEKSLLFDHVHVHIGSGADTGAWRDNIDLELAILERFFPAAETVSFGGGLKEARMPDETAADLQELGGYAKEKLEAFYRRTGRKLNMEIEPGTYVVANAGYTVTQVIDKKQTGSDGFRFIVLDGGMELNARPLLYASAHPFYVISRNGDLLSSEFGGKFAGSGYEAVVVGRCCETGDSQCLDKSGVNTPRRMAEPEIGDIVAIGGAGAYCSSMAPMNYNSHTQAPEILFTCGGGLREIRRGQTLEQIVENEI